MLNQRTWIVFSIFVIVGCVANGASDSDTNVDEPTDLGTPDDVAVGVDVSTADATTPEPDSEVSAPDVQPPLAELCESACSALEVCGDPSLTEECLSLCNADGLDAVASCVEPPFSCDDVGVCMGFEPPAPAVRWTEHIQPICAQKCGGCHTANKAAGIQVNTYADVIKPSPGCYPGKTVAQAIALKVQANPSCGNQMPPGNASPKLSAEDQQLFADWVALGWPE